MSVQSLCEQKQKISLPKTFFPCCRAGEQEFCESDLSCHERVQTSAKISARGSLLRIIGRWTEKAALGVPASILIFVPKCPACLAAYLAFGVAIGVSVTAEKYLRLLIIIPCIVSLFWMISALSVSDGGKLCSQIQPEKKDWSAAVPKR